MLLERLLVFAASSHIVELIPLSLWLSLGLGSRRWRVCLSASWPGLALGASLLVSIDSRLDTVGQGLVILAAAGGETCWFVAKGDTLGATSGVQLHFFGFALREADSADVVGVEYGDKRDGEKSQLHLD